MAAIKSAMLPLGTPCPEINLPNTEGTLINVKEYANGRPLLIAVICNHCPFVIHIADIFSKKSLARSQSLATIAINSNDVKNYPDDSPENMAKFAEEFQFNFPYLFDESQEIAMNLQAACTPDFYLYDSNGHLAYRGRLDASTPSNGFPVTGKDLYDAADALIAGKSIPSKQFPSIGCNVKWISGNEPAY